MRSIAVVVALWLALATVIDNRALLPPPQRVAGNLSRLITSGQLFDDYLLSLRRLVVSYLLAALVAIGLGIAMGLSKLADDLLDPVVELLRPISALAWIPLWLALFGISSSLPFFVIFYVALFPFLLNTVGGVRSVDSQLVKAARTMGVRDRVIVRWVVLPGALPSVLTGARLAMGVAWTALIGSELIGAPNGLGFSILFYGSNLRTADMLAVIIVIAVSGYITDLALRKLQRRLTPWSP